MGRPDKITPDVIEWLIADEKVASKWRQLADRLGLSTYVSGIDMEREAEAGTYRTKMKAHNKPDKDKLKELMEVWQRASPVTFSRRRLMEALAAEDCQSMVNWLQLMATETSPRKNEISALVELNSSRPASAAANVRFFPRQNSSPYDFRTQSLQQPSSAPSFYREMHRIPSSSTNSSTSSGYYGSTTSGGSMATPYSPYSSFFNSDSNGKSSEDSTDTSSQLSRISEGVSSGYLTKFQQNGILKRPTSHNGAKPKQLNGGITPPAPPIRGSSTKLSPGIVSLNGGQNNRPYSSDIDIMYYGQNGGSITGSRTESSCSNHSSNESYDNEVVKQNGGGNNNRKQRSIRFADETDEGLVADYKDNATSKKIETMKEEMMKSQINNKTGSQDTKTVEKYFDNLIAMINEAADSL